LLKVKRSRKVFKRSENFKDFERKEHCQLVSKLCLSLKFGWRAKMKKQIRAFSSFEILNQMNQRK